MTVEEINARFDELEAACAENERYELTEQLRWWIYRVEEEKADLLSHYSNALVPVPVGEKCKAGDLRSDAMFMCEHDGVWVLTDWYGLCIKNIATGEETGLTASAIVQPVRLVPLRELLEGRSDG